LFGNDNTDASVSREGANKVKTKKKHTKLPFNSDSVMFVKAAAEPNEQNSGCASPSVLAKHSKA